MDEQEKQDLETLMYEQERVNAQIEATRKKINDKRILEIYRELQELRKDRANYYTKASTQKRAQLHAELRKLEG